MLGKMLTKTLLVVAIFALIAKANADQPVYVGGEAELDACSSQAKIVAKKFVYLKSAPHVNAKNVTKLFPDPQNPLQVAVCDNTKDQKWVGVVVLSKNSNGCGVSSPIAKRQVYRGKCVAGWLETRQIEVVAG